jgi:hypothetical protein
MLNDQDLAHRVVEVEAFRRDYPGIAPPADLGKHRHNRYQQRTRPYGDYLWHQDREKFEADYQDWLAEQPPAARPGAGLAPEAG